MTKDILHGTIEPLNTVVGYDDQNLNQNVDINPITNDLIKM